MTTLDNRSDRPTDWPSEDLEWLGLGDAPTSICEKHHYAVRDVDGDLIFFHCSRSLRYYSMQVTKNAGLRDVAMMAESFT